jgi:hypothetical protein
VSSAVKLFHSPPGAQPGFSKSRTPPARKVVAFLPIPDCSDISELSPGRHTSPSQRPGSCLKIGALTFHSASVAQALCPRIHGSRHHESDESNESLLIKQRPGARVYPVISATACPAETALPTPPDIRTPHPKNPCQSKGSIQTPNPWLFWISHSEILRINTLGKK